MKLANADKNRIMARQVALIAEEVFFNSNDPKIFDDFKSHFFFPGKFMSDADIKSWGKNIVAKFFDYIPPQQYHKAIKKWYHRRIKRDFGLIKPWIMGRKILDYGCGKGHIGDLIARKLNREVHLVDVENRNSTCLPFYQIGENFTCFDNKQFDTTLLINVIHHARHPNLIIKEAERITKNRIIIFEHHLYDPRKSYNLLKCDWMSLFRITEELFFCRGKKNRPRLNFQTYSKLIKILNNNNLTILHEECIPFFNKKIFILDGWLFVSNIQPLGKK